MTNFEAAVIGAGPTGLVAALALARMGLEVALVAPPMRGADPSPATSKKKDDARGLPLDDRPPADHRTTALLGASIALLRNLGAWQACVAEAAPIAAVRLADDRQGLLRAPEMLFRAAEIGLDSFGANLPNPALLG